MTCFDGLLLAVESKLLCLLQDLLRFNGEIIKIHAFSFVSLQVGQQNVIQLIIGANLAGKGVADCSFNRFYLNRLL